MIVKTFHSSGRWDRSDESLERNIRRMRRDERSIGTRTEIHPRELADELHWPGDRWRHYHPMTPFGPANCSIEWDRDLWQPLDVGFEQITDFRPTTTKGYQLPPSILVWAHLEHVEHPQLVIDVSVAHMNLHNTKARNAAWYEEAHAIRHRTRRLQSQEPTWEFLFQADVNRTQRLEHNRRLVRQHLIGQSGMRNLWEGNIPATGGTHGKRSILDLALSTLPGESRLLPDDASSDHRPFENELRVRIKS